MKRRTSLLVLCIASACASCALLGDQTHTSAAPDGPLPRGVRAVRPAGRLTWHGFQIGGRPRRFVIERGDGALELDGRPVCWDQHLIGPLLPCLPVLMGAGTRVALAQIELRAAGNAMPLAVRPAEFRMLPTGASTWIAPTRCGRAASRPGALDLDAAHALDPDAPVELRDGEAIWIEFAARSAEQSAFHVRVPPGLSPTAAALELPMRVEESSFLWWGL